MADHLPLHSNSLVPETLAIGSAGRLLLDGMNETTKNPHFLANLGFLIVFGIRCNFGAAKNHMSRDYVDPWGKKHKHSFNWTSAELGVMESSFFYGYLVTQIPAGFLVFPVLLIFISPLSIYRQPNFRPTSG